MCYVDVIDATFSDHKPVIFRASFPCQITKSHSSARLCRMINSCIINDFFVAFLNSDNVSAFENPLSYLDPESLFCSFNSVCTTIQDARAPLKVRHVKSKAEPWFNDNTQALRQICRRPERKWQKDRLQVSYEMLSESLNQSAVKTAKAKY